MGVIRIQSYNSVRAKMFGKKPTWVDRMILLRSCPHTHTEFQFSKRYENVSFSATMRGKYKSARFMDIKYSHPSRWDTHEFFVPDPLEDEAYSEAQRLDGTPYDLIGLLSHATPFGIIKPHKVNVWCSEVATGLLCTCNAGFSELLTDLGLPRELKPSQLATLLDYYVKEK